MEVINLVVFLSEAVEALAEVEELAETLVEAHLPKARQVVLLDPPVGIQAVAEVAKLVQILLPTLVGDKEHQGPRKALQL